MTLAAVLLGLAALGGIALFSLRLRGGNPPLPFAFVHGLVAASGLTALVVAVVTTGTRGPAVVALGVFGFAAVGGIAMVVQHVRGRLISLPVAFLHGLTALTGYAFLLAHVLGQRT